MENAGTGKNSERDQDIRKNQLRRINFSGDKWLRIEDIPGLYYRGIQYFDFKKIEFINNNGLANLIKFLKFYLEKGIEVQFVNLGVAVKNKIRSMGLEHILYIKQDK